MNVEKPFLSTNKTRTKKEEILKYIHFMCPIYLDSCNLDSKHKKKPQEKC